MTTSDQREMRHATLRDVLVQHRGPDNPITSDALAEALGIQDSRTNTNTRRHIRTLIKTTGLPVAASPEGYYVIENRAQLDDYVESLRSRQAGIEDRIELVRKAWDGNVNQGTLDGTGWADE